jgi:hypothetical protein
MPSEDRTLDALRALAAARETFITAVAAAAEEVRALVAAGSSVNGRDDRAARELGPFAAGRIDLGRFGALFAGTVPLDPVRLETLTRAHAVLAEIARNRDELYVARVDAGDALRAAVDAALADVGRAFGAGHVVELVRSGRYRAEEHAGFLDAYPPARWNRAERQVAPPLVVEVDGSALAGAGALGELLQGRQKLVLVVTGASAVAPLVRLITPGVYVAQLSDAGGLAAVGAVDGPAIAALLPESAARFVHDPAGASLAERLSVAYAPGDPAPVALAGYTAFQQAEELKQLTTLATEIVRPAAAGEAAAAALPATPADKLAAWLLRQADLGDL